MNPPVNFPKEGTIDADALIVDNHVQRYGAALAWGICEPLPLRGFPPGKARLRMRPNDFVRVRVLTASGVRSFVVAEENGCWIPYSEEGRNVSYDLWPRPCGEKIEYFHSTPPSDEYSKFLRQVERDAFYQVTAPIKDHPNFSDLPE